MLDKVKLALRIKSQAFDSEIEDLIAAAVNEAFRQMEADSSETMSKFTGGLGGALGGGLPF